MSNNNRGVISLPNNYCSFPPSNCLIKNYSKKNTNGDPASSEGLVYGEQVYSSSIYFLGKLHPGQVLQVFIYRLFLESTDSPKRIKMDSIKAAFPAYSESSIRKRLKNCADFNRTGKKGKCQLEINGIADPTGVGEGYSYLRVPNKPSVKKDAKESAFLVRRQRRSCRRRRPAGKPNEPKSSRPVMGTDSDLRRLTLKNAREVLRKFKIPEEKINSLSRWHVIDLVRKLSTDAARTGEAAGMGKFARGAKYSLIEHQEKYKEECQRIFDLQIQVLSSKEQLSTDDEESSDEEVNIDELGKDLESMLSKKKTIEQITQEKEEAERRDLQKLLAQDSSTSSPTPSSSATSSQQKEQQEKEAVPTTGRRLVIRRKFSTETGYYYREEVISRQEVIDAYLKINETADKTNKRYLIDNLDEEQKDEVRKERRRIQEQLRRLNRAQERDRMNEKKLKKAVKEKAPINMKCGACGETGHMKTNKHCRLYGKTGPVTEDQIIEDELSNAFNEQTSDELGKDLESMLSKKKTIEQITQEKEEAERRDLQKLLAQDSSTSSPTPSSSATSSQQKEQQEKEAVPTTGRRLVIRRKFSTETGYYYREEVISRQEVIDAYLKINETADKTNKRYLIDNLDEEQKDEVRKERRRIQEQLRRLNRAQERDRMNEKKLKKAVKEKAPINMKCGACGETGHMKTNKHCRLYGKTGPVTEDQIIEDELSNAFNEQTSGMVKVEDTKIRIGRAFLAKVDEVQKAAQQKQVQQKRQLEIEGEKIAEERLLRKKKRIMEKADRKLALKTAKTLKVQEDLDYLEPKVRGSNRARVHPEVELRTFFEDLIVKLKDIPRTGAFHKPVSAREIPDYYTHISTPMDLQTMKNHCSNNFYQSRVDFLEHLEQIVTNSTIYNGKQSEYTRAAESMLDLAMGEFEQQQGRLQSLEEKINPAANKSTQNQFNLILIASMEAMVKVSHSQAFHIPVNAKVAPDYYQVISTPMDISTLKKNIEKNKYKCSSEFLKDVILIYENSQQYNGAESPYTKKAEELLQRAREVLVENRDVLAEYETLLRTEDEPGSPSLHPHTPESLYSRGVEEDDLFRGGGAGGVDEDDDEMSDGLSEADFVVGSSGGVAGEKTRLDSLDASNALFEEAGHTLYEDLLDSEDESD
eukprot:sb/3461300/